MFTKIYRCPKGTRKPRPVPFTRDEMRAIFCQIWEKKSYEIRNRAIIAFLYRGAARIGATLRMLPGDIDWTHNVVRIFSDKGSKTRHISLDDKVMGSLRKWRDKRAELGIGDDKPFFCTCQLPRGLPMDRSHVLQRLASAARKAGIKRHVNLHLLRHTGASELLEEGFDIPTISRFLGHSSLQVTYTYLHELRPDLMNAKLANREW